MASSPLKELIKVRREKLAKLEELGVDPYAASFTKKQTIAKARDSMDQQVQTAGRIMAIRDMGSIAFVDLADESGRIQLIARSDSLDELEGKILGLLDIADIIGVAGKVTKSKSGETSIEVSNLVLLSKALRPLPSSWHGLKDVEERYRKRYLDMILNPDVRDRLSKRSQIIASMRQFLENDGFIEVETPTLQPIYGGGFARPFVTHHNALDSDFYLRISDEMYLKRMIVGGFEKVYEITKVFRNEGVDVDHNPEFTMFEAQIAYQDYHYGMDIIEKIFAHIAQDVFGQTKFEYQDQTLDFGSWKRLKVVEAIKEHTGLEPLEWNDLTTAKDKAKSLELNKKALAELDKMNTVGEVIAFVFEEAVEEKLIEPTIIYDYPVEISPLAKRCEDERFTQRFELFAMGMELGNNYSELNDPVDLRRRFVEEKKREESGFDEAHQTDEDYLTAIEQGFPPTCGLGVGIDRVVMLMTNAASIKEVIAFPTLKPINKIQDGGKKPKTKRKSQ